MKARFIDLQKNRLVKGEISRRQFIRSALASGVGVTGALSLVAAAEALRPARGGNLRLALRGLDLPFAFGSALTELQPDGSLIGELAESWESNPSATAWRFALRPDVTFHSGQTLNSEDVAASLSDLRGGLLSGLTAISSDGPQVVVLSFDAPVPDLPLWLSDPAAIIRPASGSVSGTGPYIPGDWQAGRMEALRFEGWFKPDRAHFDQLSLTKDGSLAGLLDGQIDLLAQATDLECDEARTCGLLADMRQGLTRLADLGHITGRPTPDWEIRAGLANLGGTLVPDCTIRRVGLENAGTIAGHAPLDGGRIAERWWFA